MLRVEITLNEKTGATLTGYIREANREMPEYPKRPAVMVIPGGGYEYCSDRENEPVVTSFLQKGYHTFLLKYSCGEDARNNNPFKDAAKAMHEIRSHAEEWGIMADKVAVCGFSAGGHLTGTLGILSRQEDFCPELEWSREEIKPNAMILSYPVITSGEFAHRSSFEMLTGCAQDCEATRRYSLEKYVTDKVPPTFVWHNVDDMYVPMENSLLLVQQLQKYKVPYEAHFFKSGGHGVSVSTKEVNVDNKHGAHWMKLATEWLADTFGWDDF